jgi:hypothetical protein
MSTPETLVVGLVVAAALAALARRAWRLLAGRRGCCDQGCGSLRPKNRLAGSSAHVSSRRR